MRIVWDDSKRETNLAKHRLDFAELSLDFFSDALVTPARAGRFKAVGWLNEQMVVAVVFCPLGSEALSIVSLRPASQKERGSYAK